MKFLLLFLVLIISTEGANLNYVMRRLQSEQKFVKTGTGLDGVPKQEKIQGMNNASGFLSCCVVGGLGSVNKFIDARNWAIQKDKIRTDNYVLMNKYALSKQIAQRYNTIFHASWKIINGRGGHMYVTNERGKEVFNSQGLGFGH